MTNIKKKIGKNKNKPIKENKISKKRISFL
jgi:hypothetical protein